MSGSDVTQRLQIPESTDELNRLAGAFNGLLDRLATALNAQRQFMADASHELRTPVSIVRTTAQVALGRNDRESVEYRESLAIVEEQTARMTRLVDAMFLLARAEVKGIPVHREPLYLDELVNEAVRGLRVLAAARDVSVQVEGQDELPMQGDPQLLRQMIGNLLDNAIRFARPGGLVRVRLSRDSTTVQMTVIDDGPGVAAGDRDRIFERFVRADMRSDGAGLGLPIARWVAEAHGGRLILADSSAPGAEFVVHIPLNQPL
jgi:signal transduction histidine kinase